MARRIDRGRLGAVMGAVYWAIILLLAWAGWAYGSEDKLIIRPRVVMWSYSPYVVTLTIRSDTADAFCVGWGDGCTTCQEIEGSATMDHRYTSCRPDTHIVVNLGKNDKLYRKLETEFKVVGCE